MKVTNQTWLISDTHFGHANIIKYCNRPVEHEKLMLDGWAGSVWPDDVILHLGDVWFGKTDPEMWVKKIRRLPGQKYLVLGNHDKAKRSLYEEAGFEILDPFVQQGVAFTHCPLSQQLIDSRPKYVPVPVLRGHGWHTNIHGHTHNNPYHESDGKPVDGKTYINVCVENTDYAPVRLGEVYRLPEAPQGVKLA